MICIYKLTCKSRVSCFFMTLLGIVDLTTALCIPFDIHDLFHPYTNPAPIPCKIGRFLESFTAVLSGNFLVCIAFNRYFHIINPLRRYTFQQAKALAIVMIALALCLTWPQLFLTGTKTVNTPIEGIYGGTCAFRDDVHDSIYTLLFQGVLVLSYIIGFFVSFIFYGRIYFTIWKRRRNVIGEQITPQKRSIKRVRFCTFTVNNHESKKCTNITEISYNAKSQMNEFNMNAISPEIQQENNVNNCKMTNANNNPNPTSSSSSAKYTVRIGNLVRVTNSKRKTSTTRFTRIMAIVTISSILAFLPYMLVNIFHSMGLFFHPGMDKTSDLVFEFCSKSFYLNSVVNPIIYSIMNPNFRTDAINIIRKSCKMCSFKKHR